MQERWAALGLRRAQGAAILLTALLVLVYYSSWMTRLLTVFQALIIIRCNLKPNEVRSCLQAVYISKTSMRHARRTAHIRRSSAVFSLRQGSSQSLRLCTDTRSWQSGSESTADQQVAPGGRKISSGTISILPVVGGCNCQQSQHHLRALHAQCQEASQATLQRGH